MTLIELSSGQILFLTFRTDVYTMGRVSDKVEFIRQCRFLLVIVESRDLIDGLARLFDLLSSYKRGKPVI